MANSALLSLTDRTSLPVDNAAPAGATRLQNEKLLRFEQFRDHYSIDTQTTPSRDEQQWQRHVMDTLVRYAALSQGWDSYSGQAVRWDVGAFAIYVLSAVMRSLTPLPQLVPSADGSIQIEWHEKQIDLEIYITAPYACEVSYQDHRTGASFSEDLTNDFTMLADPVAELTNR